MGPQPGARQRRRSRLFWLAGDEGLVVRRPGCWLPGGGRGLVRGGGRGGPRSRGRRACRRGGRSAGGGAAGGRRRPGRGLGRGGPGVDESVGGTTPACCPRAT